jgi:hypothetical protein
MVPSTNMPTYVLDYTRRTIAAIEQAAKYSDHIQSPAFDVDVTTTANASIHKIGAARRRINQTYGDRFVVEVDSDTATQPYVKFELPFAQVIVLAAEAHRELSGRAPGT